MFHLSCDVQLDLAELCHLSFVLEMFAISAQGLVNSFFNGYKTVLEKWLSLHSLLQELPLHICY